MTHPIRNRTDRRLYHAARERAGYYTWAALRGRTLPGNDPVNGWPRGRNSGPAHRAESRVAYKAMARYWLTEARRLREAAS